MLDVAFVFVFVEAFIPRNSVQNDLFFFGGGGGYFYFLRLCVHAMLLPELAAALRSAVAVRITGAVIGGQTGGDKECPVSGVTMQLGQSLEEGCRKARLAMCPGGCGLVFGGQPQGTR